MGVMAAACLIGTTLGGGLCWWGRTLSQQVMAECNKWRDPQESCQQPSSYRAHSGHIMHPRQLQNHLNHGQLLPSLLR